jgi:hypothetical protein
VAFPANLVLVNFALLAVSAVVSDPNGWSSAGGIIPSEAGVYHVIGSVRYSVAGPLATDRFQSQIYLNGGVLDEDSESPDLSAGLATCRISTFVRITNPGVDLIQLGASESASGGVQVIGTATQGSTWLGAYRVA